MEINMTDCKKWIHKTNDKIQANKDYLTSLDQAIGDGDHGINMARGFQEVITKMDQTSYHSPADLLKDVAMTLLSKVGGASGPLYGTAFLKMSTAVQESESIHEERLIKGLEEALNGIQHRGKAQVGDKTLIDVWDAVVTQMKNEKTVSADQLQRTAKQAMESTKELEAKKGRAAYLKERSVGHLDPGSVSSYYLFTSLAEVLQEGAS